MLTREFKVGFWVILIGMGIVLYLGLPFGLCIPIVCWGTLLSIFEEKRKTTETTALLTAIAWSLWSASWLFRGQDDPFRPEKFDHLLAVAGSVISLAIFLFCVKRRKEREKNKRELRFFG